MTCYWPEKPKCATAKMPQTPMCDRYVITFSILQAPGLPTTPEFQWFVVAKNQLRQFTIGRQLVAQRNVAGRQTGDRQQHP
jgi:hypothetical protein